MRQRTPPITRALDFIERGSPDSVRDFMAHAREICIRRGIIVSGFPTGTRRTAKAAPAKDISSVWSNEQNPYSCTTITELPPGSSITHTSSEIRTAEGYTGGTPEPVYTEHGA